MDVSLPTTGACAACGAALLPGDHFCEQCGTDMAEAVIQPLVTQSCRACGAPADKIDADGYCGCCGVRQRQPVEREELDLATAAGVSDQGRIHLRNEDAFHLEAVEDGVVAVVCDGISSSAHAAMAARIAAGAAGRRLADALRGGHADLMDATTRAMRAARDAVAEMSAGRGAALEPPGCTVVSAVCRDGEIVIGSVGDSRAYWMSAEASRQLTIDDSWGEEQVAAGRLTVREANGDPRSHAVTHWLGADAPDDPPRVVSFPPTEPGRLLLCSDGLWNYAPAAGDIAHLIAALPTDSSPSAIARSLVQAALAAGGRDNVTAVVIDIDPPRKADP
jgi:serine/threonine protein phosphatase PrpC